jgi:hypothetical protein
MGIERFDMQPSFRALFGTGGPAQAKYIARQAWSRFATLRVVTIIDDGLIKVIVGRFPGYTELGW